MAFYEIALLGTPADVQIAALREEIEKVVSAFRMELGKEVSWLIKPVAFSPAQRSTSVAVFFGAPGAVAAGFDAADLPNFIRDYGTGKRWQGID